MVKVGTQLFLLVHIVAKRIGVRPRTIRLWAQTGRLPAQKLGPRIWIIHPDALANIPPDRRREI